MVTIALRSPRAVPCLLLCFATALAQAQLVFITQPSMRNWYNSMVPGVVDANGFLNTQDPGLAQITSAGLSVNGNITMVEGLAYLPNLTEFSMFSSGACVPYSIDGWPPNIQTLILDECAISTLPSWPPALQRLVITGAFNSFPMPLPPGLLELELYTNPILSSFPALPASLTHLTLELIGAVDLSDLPPALQVLDVWNCPDLDTLGALPASLTLLRLNSVPGLVSIPPSCPITVRELSVPSWAIEQWGALPDSLRTIFIGQNWQAEFNNGLPYPGLCIPHLPEHLEELYLSVYPDMALLPVCLPNTPPSLVQAVYFYTIMACVIAEYPVQPCAGPDPDCPSSSTLLKGLTFQDQNGDGLMNGAEPITAGAVVSIEPGGLLTASDQNGLFSALPGIGSFTVTRAAQPYWTVTTPLQTSDLLSFGAIDSLDALGAMAIPGMYDLRADVTCSQSSPGFTTTCWCHVQNVGTEPQTGLLSLTLDADQSFLTFGTTPDNVVGNDATWSVPVVPPGQTWSVLVTIQTSTGVTLGTTVQHSVSVSPEFTDQTVGDNTATWSDVVVGSYDPNDKMVQPAFLNWSEVAAGTSVEYTIRFQNTGTAPAQNVIISDSLSADLQWSTFEPLASSHAHTWYIQEGVLYFRFDNIILPDSNSNEAASHGFVKFSMKPVTDLMPGESVANAARIHFDYNGAITTNDAVFEVGTSTGLAEDAAGTISVWPNPATDRILVVGAERGTTILLLDPTGRVVSRQPVRGSVTVLDLDNLSSGLYMVRTVDGAGVAATFLKQ